MQVALILPSGIRSPFKPAIAGEYTRFDRSDAPEFGKYEKMVLRNDEGVERELLLSLPVTVDDQTTGIEVIAEF